MDNLFIRIIILAFIFMFLTDFECNAFSQTSLEELKSAHEMMSEDFNLLKRKVWMKMAPKLRMLKRQVDGLKSEDVCKDSSSIDHNNSTVSEDTAERDLAEKNDIVKCSTLLNVINEEKLIVRCLEETLNNLVKDFSVMKNKIQDYESVMTHVSTNVTQTAEYVSNTASEFATHLEEMFALQDSHNNLYVELTEMEESFRLKLDEIDKAGKTSSFRKPSFVSKWMLMRAQDSDYSQKTVPHGLGTLPYKVDVQIRPISGPNAGWIFSGDSGIQSDDDDSDETYGGAIYFYDETNVYIMVPLANNNYKVGFVINTGETQNRRLGNNHQASTDAYVRVKVWAPTDLPKPDLKSEWLPLDINNRSLAYYELSHSLNAYPGLVNVQIRCNSSVETSIISEGLGATPKFRAYSNAGGVIHAFSDTSVRVWAGLNVSNGGDNRLFGAMDGWKHSILNNLQAKEGEFRVLVWSDKNITTGDSEFEKHEENTEFAEWSAFEKFSPDNDLFSFYVQANDGLNKGFRFRGYGNSQSMNSPFGGAVYAYNPNGDVRIWRPNPSVGGHLVHINYPYGDGINAQATNDVHYVSTLLGPK